MTKYPKKDRPKIKADAIKGILNTTKNEKQKATLLTLIDQTIRLNKDENEQYLELIKDVKLYKEVKMYNTIEEMLLDKGRTEGKIEGEIEGERRGIKWMLDGIELGLKTKFGQDGLKEIPKINKLDDVNILMAIQRGLWTMDSLTEISKLYQ